jgi:hypothetical protein
MHVEVSLADRRHHAGFSVVPWINDQITGQVYEPVLAEVEQLPPGLITSIYAPLRSYLKKHHPDLFAKMREAVENTPDREYSVLGDPLVHVILPLLPSEDQVMLLDAGKQAFVRDFGFEPKGLWLPETAVSKEVLNNASLAGYEFVPLRDSQVTNIPEGISLDAQHSVCFVDTGDREIAVLLGNSGLSGFVSYSPWSTYNADEFMQERQNNEQRNGWNSLTMTDLERWGHHQEGADQFLKRALAIQQDYGFSPINMKQELVSGAAGGGKTKVDVIDDSSWSCAHALGRWKGTCCCDEPSPQALEFKSYLYNTLQDMNNRVNGQLDAVIPGWRKDFASLFVELSDDIFTGENFGPALLSSVEQAGGDVELAKLYLAKIEIMVGMTSCGWFFGGEGRHERDIPANMIQGVQDLFAVAQPA